MEMVQEMGPNGRESLDEIVRLLGGLPTAGLLGKPCSQRRGTLGRFFDSPTRLLFLHLIQGSLDNMTCMVVCFPGAPKPCEEAIRREMALDAALSHKVAGEQSSNGQWEGRLASMGSLLTSSSELYSSAQEPPCLNTVFRALASEDIPGLPPGGGLHSK